MTTLASVTDIVTQLNAANAAYRAGAPIMSDSDYDQLESALRAIEPTHPLLTTLADDEYGLEQPLTIPMGSQQKALTLDELAPYLTTTADSEYFISQKLDGASCELTYVDGRFIQALTRGDGTRGVNVTTVVARIPSVPQTIPDTRKLVVRGELMLRKSDLAALNVALTAAGREPYQNVRNGAVALIKTLKNLDYAQYLSFKAFDLKYVD